MRGHRRGHSAIRQRGGRCRRHDGVPYDLTAGAGDRGARRGSPFRCDPLLEGTDTDVLVGGQTAGVVDFSEANGERLPILIAVVIGLSFILLAVVFRSILVPIKAAIMNVLPNRCRVRRSRGDVPVGLEQGSRGCGYDSAHRGVAPMMLFAILFGLSMDYEIFMLSRIREEYLRTGDHASAVANELANTARVITAAAAIMVMLFLSFVFGFEERAIKLFGVFVFGFEERAIKLFGVGLAVAIAGRRPTNSACSSASGSSTSTSTRCSRRSLRRATSAGAAARGA
jgi:uncharacterized membrane protein YdfJ with MMPL/SSD domain